MFQPLNVLLVEDHRDIARTKAEDLQESGGHNVTHCDDPREAARLLARARFDVAIVDLSYEQSTEDYHRRLHRRWSLLDGELLLSGLYVLHAIQKQSPKTKVVVWSATDIARMFYIRFAYEEFGARVFLSKRSANRNRLLEAVAAAHSGRRFEDEDAKRYFPRSVQSSLASTFFGKPNTAAVWRALALGAKDYDELKSVVYLETGTLKNMTGPICRDLDRYLGRAETNRGHFKEVSIFASDNKYFLLDEAIKLRFPHRP